jgi:hypothetical protein
MAILDIIKYEGDNSTFVWKHPCEDFNSMTQLIVHESQEAIFFMNGQALDMFGAGRHTLETQNVPKIGKFLNRATGGDTPFHCEVYFINKTVQMSIKWGTDSKIRFIEPSMGIPLEIGACGEMNMEVSDSRALLLKLVGTMNGIAWGDSGAGFTKSIQNCFRPLISTAVKAHLVSSIKSQNIDILEIDENLEALSEVLRKAIADHLLSYRGIKVDPEQIIIGAGTEYLYNLIIQLLGKDKVIALNSGETVTLHTKDHKLIDDLIIKAGMNIYPAEVEKAIRQDPRTREVLVYGYRDDRGVQIGMKIVGNFASVEEIHSLCARLLPDFQRPNRIEVVPELPKNGSGKIIRGKEN